MFKKKNLLKSKLGKKLSVHTKIMSPLKVKSILYTLKVYKLLKRQFGFEIQNTLEELQNSIKSNWKEGAIKFDMVN